MKTHAREKCTACICFEKGEYVDLMKVMWSSKTGHFSKQLSYKTPSQNKTGIDNLKLNTNAGYCKTQNSQ
ncbi:MAG: hypothetical protein NTV00_10320 [Methylococcales bacterium]|nr:hypothetical protein [Methylococcales bacterium]